MKRLCGIWSLVVVICTFVSCTALNNISDKLTPPFIANKSDLVKVVYIDQSFGMWEDAIVAGLKAWECKTNGMVRFTIIRDVDLDNLNMVIDPATSLIIKRVVSTDEVIIEEDKKLAPYVAVGVYLPSQSNEAPTIVICSDRLWGNAYYSVLTEHEIGHSIAMRHNSNTHSVMFPIITNTERITDDDLKTFCSIYGCDSTQFKSKCE